MLACVEGAHAYDDVQRTTESELLNVLDVAEAVKVIHVLAVAEPGHTGSAVGGTGSVMSTHSLIVG